MENLYGKLHSAYKITSRYCDSCTAVTQYPIVIAIIKQYMKWSGFQIRRCHKEIPLMHRLLAKCRIYKSRKIRIWLDCYDFYKLTHKEATDVINSYISALENLKQQRIQEAQNPYKPPVRVEGYVKYAKYNVDKSVESTPEVCSSDSDRSADTGSDQPVHSQVKKRPTRQSQPKSNRDDGHDKGSASKKRRSAVRKKRVDSQGEGAIKRSGHNRKGGQGSQEKVGE